MGAWNDSDNGYIVFIDFQNDLDYIDFRELDETTQSEQNRWIAKLQHAEAAQYMFSCGSNNLAVDKNRGQISYELLGSMKEYWRQTENVYVKGHPKSNTDDKNRE